MSPNEAKDAIRFLDKEIAAEIGRSEKGKAAYEDANLSGPSHIGGIIISQADFDPASNAVTFRAFVEIYDSEEHQYEAEIEGECEKADGAWKRKSLQVLDAGPLPKSG